MPDSRRTIGDRNSDFEAELRRFQNALVSDERDTSRQSLVIIIPQYPDDAVQVIQNGITVQLDESLTVEDLFRRALLEREQLKTSV